MSKRILECMKKLLRKGCKVYNRLPFINSITVRGKKNRLELLKPIIKSRISIHGSNNRVVIEPGGVCRNLYIHIDGDNNTILIKQDASIRKCTLYTEDSNNTITIGKGTKICGETEIACIEGTSVTIGEGCLFSSDIKMRTGDSHSITDLEGNRINNSENICIGNRVWVGNNVKILKGVVISEDSIIGTASVVTKSISEKNVIIGGIPAQVIKHGVRWKEERL